jgi:aminoglycoside 6'-N-acetyltransferase
MASCAAMGSTLHGDQVVLRPLEAADRERMRAMLAEPEIAERWLGTNTPQRLLEELYDASEHTAFAILLDDDVIGYIQYSEENDADYRHAGIDMFLGTAWHGRGLGRDALRALVRHLIRDRGHHRVTIDPAASNERAIRAYRAVGFRDVGLMRDYERGRDGTWHDGLLMDLLAREFEDDDGR